MFEEDKLYILPYGFDTPFISMCLKKFAAGIQYKTIKGCKWEHLHNVKLNNHDYDILFPFRGKTRLSGYDKIVYRGSSMFVHNFKHYFSALMFIDHARKYLQVKLS
jgi:hypothetical protein